MKHPFERLPNYRYGFDKGQEIEWFNFVCKYYTALKDNTRRLNSEKYEDGNKMDLYIALKEERGLFEYILFMITSNEFFRQYHTDFLKSKELDITTKVKLKNKYVKNYQESEYKDGKYYLSLIKC